MPLSKFYVSLAICLLILCPSIQAKASKPLPATTESTAVVSSKVSANAKAKVGVDMNSPLLQKEAYPLWMQMDIQEAPALMQALILQAEEKIAAICQLKPEEMSYENTFDALDESQDAAYRCCMSIAQLNLINSSPELIKAREKIVIAWSTFISNIVNNEALWKNLKIAAAQDWVPTLSPAKKRNIQTNLDYFKDNGAELQPAKKKRLLKIVNEIEIQQLKFAGNTRTPADYHLNEPIAHRIVLLRQELAQLLGFENFASYQTKHHMIGGEAKMRRFIKGMIAQLKPAFDKEVSELLAFISEQKGEKITKIDIWEYYYYLNLLKEQRFQFNEKELSAYFPHEQVMHGMFCVFEQLFNIRLKEKAGYCPKKGEKTPAKMAEIWHPDVRVFDVFDASSNKHLGSFYLDLFYREEKYAGAWMKPIRIGNSEINGQGQLAALIGNFHSKNAQFQHIEVLMLFHEMGHILHFMLSETELRSQATTHIAIDLVEFPSQLIEHYSWRPEVLDIIARHHETGAKMPDQLKQKLLRSQHFMPAINNMYFLSQALLDLKLHSQYDKLFKGKKLAEASDIILKGTRLPYNTLSSAELLVFMPFYNKIYASGFYSYIWGKVLAADAFSRFLKDGILNPNTGKHFREAVLSKGDSAHAMELFKNFMGREPNADALLEQQGILPAKDKNN